MCEAHEWMSPVFITGLSDSESEWVECDAVAPNIYIYLVYR